MIIEHNEKNPSSQISIPKKITESLIYQDAILYKTAKEHGVKIIGLEGKDLEQNKNSPNYDKNREEYMANVIKKVTGKGYKFIANVGAAHEKNIKQILEFSDNDGGGNLGKIPKKLEHNISKIRSSLKEHIMRSNFDSNKKDLPLKATSSKNSQSYSK
jgi:hypothetical protein